jgi:hypothetical protein
MQDFTGLIIIPVIVIVIGLIIEYWIIQPVRKKSELVIPSSPAIDKDWAIAIRTGVEQFKSQQTDFRWKWWLPNRNTVTIEAWNIRKDQADLTLVVSEKYPTFQSVAPDLLYYTTSQRIIARFELALDDIGTILRMRSLPVVAPDRGTSLGISQSDLPETDLTIKNIRRPTVEKVDGKAIVTIEFDVENSGRAGKVCPYVEFQVVALDKAGKLVPQPFRTALQTYHVSALSIQPFTFQHTFYAPEWPLVEPPNKVRIGLSPCTETP